MASVYQCPAFEHLRVARQHLVAGLDVPDMTAFMRQRDQKGVMCHILACIQEIRALADVDRSFDVDLNLCQDSAPAAHWCSCMYCMMASILICMAIGLSHVMMLSCQAHKLVGIIDHGAP